jgi:hypothetical protein
MFSGDKRSSLLRQCVSGDAKKIVGSDSERNKVDRFGATSIADGFQARDFITKVRLHVRFGSTKSRVLCPENARECELLKELI